MANTIEIKIDNCKDCQNHCIERIYTADSFEHVEGLYCKKVVDNGSPNGKYKLVADDDRDVTKYSQIPDWCPLLNTNLDRLL